MRNSKLETRNSKLYCLAALLLIGSLHAASPTLTEQTPSPGGFALSNHPTISFTANSPDNASILGDSVELFVDGIKQTLVYNDDADEGSWSCTVSQSLTNGPHWASVAVIDDNGNGSVTKWSFQTDLSAPVVSITPDIYAAAAGSNVFIQGTFGGLYNQSMSSLDIVLTDSNNSVYTYPANVVWDGQHGGTFSLLLPEVSPGWVTIDAVLTAPGGAQATSEIGLNVYLTPDVTFANQINGSYFTSDYFTGSYTSSWAYSFAGYELAKGDAPFIFYITNPSSTSVDPNTGMLYFTLGTGNPPNARRWRLYNAYVFR